MGASARAVDGLRAKGRLVCYSIFSDFKASTSCSSGPVLTRTRIPPIRPTCRQPNDDLRKLTGRQGVSCGEFSSSSRDLQCRILSANAMESRNAVVLPVHPGFYLRPIAARRNHSMDFPDSRRLRSNLQLGIDMLNILSPELVPSGPGVVPNGRRPR